MILSVLERNIDGTVGYMSDFWTLTAATEQSGYPVSNLLTPDLNQKWVSWGQRTSHNWIEVAGDERSTARDLSIVTLLGIDRTYPVSEVGTFRPNTFRIIIDHFPIATRRRPVVNSVTLTNLSGTAATINGPIDPPNLTPTGYISTKMTSPNAALNTVLQADFENYNATERPLLAGATQLLRLHYVHSADQSLFPALTVKLRYSGTTLAPVLALQATEETSEGYMLSYEFTSADLGGITGQVGLHITGTSTGTSTPLPIGVEWVAELEGWGTAVESWESGALDIEHKQIAALPRNPEDTDTYQVPEFDIRYVYLELSDFAEELPFNVVSPLGGHEGVAFYAGRFIAAQGISIDLKETGGYNRRKVSDVGILRTRGGSFRGARNPLHWDEHDFNCRIQAQSVLLIELENFFEQAGMRNPVAIVPDETIPSQTVYGLLTRWETQDVGAWTPPSGVSDQYYDLSFSAIDARARQTLR